MWTVVWSPFLKSFFGGVLAVQSPTHKVFGRLGHCHFLGGGFKHSLFSPQKIVHLPHFDKHIFSDGLVQPPTSLFSVKRTFRYSQPSLPWLTMFCFSHILGEAHMSLVRSSGRSQPLFERPGCICSVSWCFLSIWLNLILELKQYCKWNLIRYYILP